MDWLRTAAASRPKAPAVITGSSTVTYEDLDRAADGVAAIVGATGHGGRSIGVAGDRDVETVAAIWGMQRAGSTPVMVDQRRPVAQQQEAVRVAGAKGLWTTPDGGWDALVARSGGEVPAAGFPSPSASIVVFTSGSEGEPKPVTLRGEHVASSVEGSRLRLGNHGDDVWLDPLPLAHVGGLSVLWRQAEQAAPVRLLAPGEALADALGQVTLASVVPTMLKRALDAGAVGPAVLLVGGGPVSVEALHRARHAGFVPLETYGMTETASQVCTVDPLRLDEEMGTAGRPITGAEVRIDPAGRIEVRGSMVAVLDGTGEWHRTGDLGRLDEAGRLTVLGRADDVIVTGSENVHPAAVQAVLEAHPAVDSARVFGEPDDEWGSRVVAELVLASDEQLDAILSWAEHRLSPAETPKALRVIDQLPTKLGQT